MLLSRLASSLGERRRGYATDAPGNAGAATAAARIGALLSELVASRALLTVTLSGVDEVYSSAALECVPEGRYLVIDELVPEAGNAWAVPGRRITISARLSGGVIALESIIDAVGTGNGIAYYRIPFPRRVEHRQRREHFRATLPLELAVPVQMLRADGRALSGELRDISRGGLSLRLDPGPNEPPRVGEVLSRCIIAASGGGAISTRVEICYAEAWNGRKRPRLGGRFIEVDRRTEREIDAYVTRIDREHARRASRV